MSRSEQVKGLNDSGKRWVLFALTSLLALTLAFWAIPPAVGVEWVTNFGYYVVLVTFVWFLGALVRAFDWERLPAWFVGGGWKPVCFILVVSALMHVQERHGFKIVNDEVVQLSTSQRMHALREASTAARGYELSTNFVLLQGTLDKRPLFFPFLVSVVHDLTGYRPANIFVLNALLTPIMLGLLYGIGARFHGWRGGTTAVLLWISIPLVTQTACGGGFEILNIVMILTAIVLGGLYADRPDTARLGAFCLSGVLLAQVRYESVLFVLPVGLLILLVWWRNRKAELNWAVLLAPLLLVIYPMQQAVFKQQPDMWQLQDRPSANGAFSFSYFYENVGSALNYFFSANGTQPNSHAVFVLGIFGIGFLTMYFYRHHRRILREEPAAASLMIFIGGLLLHSMVILCYFWGAFDDVLTVRLSLPTQLLLVLAFVFIAQRLLSRHFGWSHLQLGLLVYIIVWTLPTINKRAYAHENFAAETANWYRGMVDEFRRPGILVLEPAMGTFWVAHEVSGINFDALARRVDEFLYHLNQGTFDTIAVVQKLGLADPSTGELAPVDAHSFNGSFTLETMEEIRFSPTYAMRVSRVVNVDEVAFREWARTRKSAPGTASEAGASRISDITSIEKKFSDEWIRKLP